MSNRKKINLAKLAAVIVTHRTAEGWPMGEIEITDVDAGGEEQGQAYEPVALK